VSDARSAATARMVARQKELLDRVFERGQTIVRACEEMGISRGAYYQWRKDENFCLAFDARRAGKPPKGGELHAGGFTGFRRRFFGFETYAWQASVVRSFENAAGMSISMVLVPPGMGKSTLVEDWINYKLAIDPNHRILVISESQKHAKKLIARVKNRMTDPSMSAGVADYIDTYGPFRDKGQGKAGQDEKPWTTEYITVAKASHDERDFSLEAKGWASQIYGARADTIILDDVQSIKTARRTADIMEKFHQDVVTRPGRNGRIIIVGTRLAVGDFYEKLVERGVIAPENYIEFPAVLSEGEYNPVAGQWGRTVQVAGEPDRWEADPACVEPLCPEMWPAEELGRMRRLVGEPVWWRAYMQRPQSAGDATFSDAMIAAADDPTLFCEAPVRQNPDGIPTRLGVICMVDPALGGGNAVITAAWDLERFYVIDCQLDYGLARNEDIFLALESQAARHRPSHVIIERTAMQRGIARDDRLLVMGARLGFRIIEHETAGTKMDVILGVGQMAGSFLRKEISLAAGDEISRARLAPLRAELAAWRPGVATRFMKQDTVMATWFGWRWWMQQRTLAATPVDGFRLSRMPYRGTGALPSRLAGRWKTSGRS